MSSLASSLARFCGQPGAESTGRPGSFGQDGLPVVRRRVHLRDANCIRSIIPKHALNIRSTHAIAGGFARMETEGAIAESTKNAGGASRGFNPAMVLNDRAGRHNAVAVRTDLSEGTFRFFPI